MGVPPGEQLTQTSTCFQFVCARKVTYSLWRRQAKTGLNMSAFAGHIITCFTAFSRVTWLAFATELLVRISKKTLSIVKARFVDTNILVKKKRNLDLMTFYYYVVDLGQFPFQSVESRLGRASQEGNCKKAFPWLQKTQLFCSLRNWASGYFRRYRGRDDPRCWRDDHKD